MLLLVVGILLTLPPVQTEIARYITKELKKSHKVDINIEEVSVTIFGKVKLKQVLVKDHHQDTLIHINMLKTSILNRRALVGGKLIFDELVADGLFFHLKKYKGEDFTNLDVLIDAFDDGKPSTGKFLMTANFLNINNGRFLMQDFNNDNPLKLDFKNLHTGIQKFKIRGGDVAIKINQLSFKDHTGLEVKKLKSDFTYTMQYIVLNNLNLETAFSKYVGKIRLDYNREDFADFNNKVFFTFLVDDAKISSTDIYHFYNGIGKDVIFEIDGDFKGTLNALNATNFTIKDNLNNVIKGNLSLSNMFHQTNDYEIKGRIDQLNTNVKNLEKLLPEAHGKGFFPKEAYKLGTFNYAGDITLTPKYINTSFDLQTAIGGVVADIKMQNLNQIEQCTYQGHIETNEFNLGYLTDNKDLGKLSLKVDISGKGFTQNSINTMIKGDIYAIDYNNYRYRNIILDGLFKKPIFKGSLNINDTHLLMDFDGLIDVSKQEHVYQFNATVDYANLKKLNFRPKDSIAIFKGKIHADLKGNSIDNIHGDVFMESASYQNNKKVYTFDEFTVESYFDENSERSIILNSGDLLKGSIVGKFSFGDIIPLVENALGSTYSNFNPNKVKKGQFINFNFGVFSQLLEIFYPEISIDNKTQIRGKIVGDENIFELNLKSRYLNLPDVELKNLSLTVDNKNPLFNTFVEIDSILHKNYKLSDFNLINVTSNDTLFMRSEFKGGKQATDDYALNFYHTIDNQKNNVIGLKKSDINISNIFWYINEKDDNQTAIIFDNKLNNFNFKNIVLSHYNQNIKFEGEMFGNNEKEFSIQFNEVLLEEILPNLETISLKGSVNGEIDIKQANGLYKPNANLNINQLVVNETEIGNFSLKFLGDNDYQILDLNSFIELNGKKTFNAEGKINYVNKTPSFLVDIDTRDFNIGTFSSLGGDVISNIRGFVSGDARLQGNLEEPKLNGRLFLTKAGLKIPYINVDFNISDNAIVDLTENQFKISNTRLTDTKYKTDAIMRGTVNHRNLNNWVFDLNFSTDRLVAFDKEDDDETPYYGVAFIKGTTAITGPINKLVINVNASSEKGTSIKIPISNTLGASENSYIYFVTPEDKYNISKKEEINAISGLELNFDLDINKNAEFEIILDKGTGHAMKGTGGGGILMEINTLGKFNMYGDFVIWDGTYDYKYRGIINKKFEVEKGGYIVWDGDPLKARINAKAVYRTTANPSLLLVDFDGGVASRRIPVEVGINIDGTLDDPKPQFELDFPNVSSVFKSEIETQLNNQDTKDQQAIYLLATGTFFNANLGMFNQDIVFNNLFEAVSGIVGDVINTNDNINLSLDYSSGRRGEGNIPIDDATVGLRTSFIINDRLSFRGSLGVPVGGFTQNSFIGSGEFLYRVNADGSLNFRTFYRENDINFIGEGIGFTSGVGLSYQVDFDNFKELKSKIFSGFRKVILARKEDEISDSFQSPEYIQMINLNEKKPKKVEKNETNDGPSEGD